MRNIPNNLTYSQWEELIDDCIIGRNAKRNRSIFKMALLDGLTYATIAKQFRLSERQIQNIVNAGKKQMFKNL